jgi:hypothetical protein
VTLSEVGSSFPVSEGSTWEGPEHSAREPRIQHPRVGTLLSTGRVTRRKLDVGESRHADTGKGVRPDVARIWPKAAPLDANADIGRHAGHGGRSGGDGE